MKKKAVEEGEGETPRVDEKEVFGDIKRVIIRGKSSESKKPTLSGDRVIVYDTTLSSKLNSKNFGDLKKNSLYLSLYEAYLFLDENKLRVFDKSGKEIDVKGLMRMGESLNENFGMKYDVYRDLRLNRGYVVKSGLKFGCDFVVYDKGKNPGSGHSKWMVQVIPEVLRVDFNEITRAARLATNVKKSMIFAIVTERGPVYYQIGRKKM
ncbi:MAG: tRNA-intron lyase [Candidatus Altiarchaeota archaeon]|nr:tRNA-intron lyase [Candidatus Altiarchaeota archaeon]